MANISNLKEEKPVAWALIAPPEANEMATWLLADAKFVTDTLPALTQDSDEGQFLPINSDTAKILRKSLRKVFKTVGDKRKVPWHNQLDGFLNRLQRARRDAEPQTEIQRIKHRTFHSDNLDEYKQYARVSSQNRRAAGTRVTVAALRRGIKKKFGLPTLPPINVVTDIVAELREEEHAQEIQAAMKKGREEGRQEVQSELNKTKERLAKLHAARAQEAVKSGTPETRPAFISYQKPSENDPTIPMPERRMVATSDITSVGFATDPTSNLSYVLLVKKDGTTVVASPHSDDRNAVSRLEAWFRSIVTLPLNEVVDAPSLNSGAKKFARPKL